MASFLPLPLAKAKEDYERDGFARIPAVFTDIEMAAIRIAAEASVKRNPERVTWINHKPALLHWPKKLSPVLADICDSPQMAEIVRYFLGDKVRQILNQLHVRGPYSTEEYAWHQDIILRTPTSDFVNLEQHYLQTVIVVDKMERSNAPLEFVPGSHKLGNLKLHRTENDPRINRFVRDNRESVKIEAMPGDVLIWHLHTIHGSAANCSDKPRMTYLSGFAADHAIVAKERFPLWSPNAE